MPSMRCGRHFAREDCEKRELPADTPPRWLMSLLVKCTRTLPRRNSIMYISSYPDPTRLDPTPTASLLFSYHKKPEVVGCTRRPFARCTAAPWRLQALR
jgi:hypothetical protein